MSIRSNFTGMLLRDCTGGPGDGFNPLSMCCWARIVGRVGAFGAILMYENALVNNAPGFLTTNLDNGLYFTSGPGRNFKIIEDPSRWFFVGLSWPGTGSVCTAVGLDSDGKWTEVQDVSAGVNENPAVFIGGGILNGVVVPDADVEYRGVHVWQEAKGVEFLRQQSRQLAPYGEGTIFSTTYFYDLSIAQLGQSMVGRPWQNALATVWTVSNSQKVDPGNGVTPLAITFTGAIAQGDSLVAYLGTTGNNVPPAGFGTFVDTSGNAWRIVDTRQTANGLITTWLLVAENVNAALAGANVATWTPVGMNTSFVFGCACEVHCSVGTPAFDVSDGAIGNDGAPTASHIATTPDGLQIGCCANSGFDGAPDVGTSGYTQLEQCGAADAVLGSLVATSTHATTAGFETGSGGTPQEWTAQIAVFKAAGSAWTTSPDSPPRPSTLSGLIDSYEPGT